MEDFGLVITPRGRHFSPHEAACGAERHLRIPVVRAMFAHAGASMPARACGARALRTTAPHVLDKPHFFTFASDGKFGKVQSSNLLLPARFGLPPTARSLSSGFAQYRASLVQAVMRKGKLQSRGSIARAVDRLPRSSVHTWVHEDKRVCSLRGGASAATAMVCTLFKKTALGFVSLAATRCTACFDIPDPQFRCQRLLGCHDPRAERFILQMQQFMFACFYLTIRVSPDATVCNM